MANRQRMPCFVCDAALLPRNMARTDRDDDVIKREIAILHRDAAHREFLEITDRTRLCNNCNISIVNELRVLNENPSALRLKVLSQTSSHTCLICNGNNNLTRLTIKSRVNVYIKKNIYMSENSKCCQRHLDDEGLLLEELLDGLRFVDRPYVIKGIQLKQFLEELLHNANSMFVSRYDNENNFTDEEFQLQKNSLENCLHFVIPFTR